MKTIKRTFAELAQYPSAVLGLVIIAVFVVISIYAVIAIPYQKAVDLWRGGERIWYKTPKMVPPTWVNLFRAEKLPDTFSLNTLDDASTKQATPSGDGQKITITLDFDYNYDSFPQELSLYFTSTFAQKAPFVSAVWVAPDGRQTRLVDYALQSPKQTFRFSQDKKLVPRLFGKLPQEALFAVPKSDPLTPLKGKYQIQLQVTTFEKDSTVDVEFVQYGQVYGMAGTDHQRRDLSIALLWGMPVALSFGLIAALGTSLAAMVIAAFGAWYGGWIDELIQRITEVNLVLPFLPILIMIGTFYDRSIVTILTATILLSIFGGSIKGYRAIFLQVREMPYIEAARAYGAGDARIILRYLLPRIIPLLIPALVTGIPGYVFLEASLAVLGLGDPVLPTWGKIIQDAEFNGALFNGLYYWILEPAALLMITGLAFSMLGFSLDRIFNPRLRGL